MSSRISTSATLSVLLMSDRDDHVTVGDVRDWLRRVTDFGLSDDHVLSEAYLVLDHFTSLVAAQEQRGQVLVEVSEADFDPWSVTS